jgi:leucine dehydrogenase
MHEKEDLLDYAARLNCQELHMTIDNETGLKAIVAIHSTKLGPALGGCRWLEYVSTEEAAYDAIRLAQSMTYKSAIAGLDLGGGKAVLLKPKGIMEEVNKEKYFRAFGRFLNLLQGRYITAVDSGTSTQEMDYIAKESKYVTSISHSTYSTPDPSVLTSYGVFRGIEAAVKFRLQLGNLSQVSVAVQGLGHVGYHLVELLCKAGAKVYIFDIDNALLNKCLQDFAQYKVFAVGSAAEILMLPVDVFSPCALGGILNEKTIPKIKASIIAGGANNQLLDPIDDMQRIKDRGILYAPDFIINAGGVIYVAGEYARHTETSTKEKISNIYDILIKVFVRSEQENSTTYEIAHKMAIERLHGEG